MFIQPVFGSSKTYAQTRLSPEAAQINIELDLPGGDLLDLKLAGDQLVFTQNNPSWGEDAHPWADSQPWSYEVGLNPEGLQTLLPFIAKLPPFKALLSHFFEKQQAAAKSLESKIQTVTQSMESTLRSMRLQKTNADTFSAMLPEFLKWSGQKDAQ